MQDNLDEIMNVFLKHFTPASNILEADQTMTTEEIRNTFEEFFQDEINNENLINLLKTHGFKYDWVIDGFKWLLKSVN